MKATCEFLSWQHCILSFLPQKLLSFRTDEILPSDLSSFTGERSEIDLVAIVGPESKEKSRTKEHEMPGNGSHEVKKLSPELSNIVHKEYGTKNEIQKDVVSYIHKKELFGFDRANPKDKRNQTHFITDEKLAKILAKTLLPLSLLGNF